MEEKIQVIKFWAPWCGPCKMMATFWNKVSSQFAGQAEFVEANVDEEEAEEEAQAFDIRSVPTVIIYNLSAKKEIARHSGAMSLADTTKWIQENLDSISKK